MAIAGIKLIEHNMANYRVPDDPSYPFKLELVCRVPEFMEFAASMLWGTERVVVRGMTREALEEFDKVNGLSTHSRKIRFEITGPAAPAKEVVNK